MNTPTKPRPTAITLAMAAVATLGIANANAQQLERELNLNPQPAKLFEAHLLHDALVLEPLNDQSISIDVDLIVSGPEGFYLRKSFPAGDLVEFNPASLAEDALPDGTYVFETRIMGLGNGNIRRSDDQAVEFQTDTLLPNATGAFSVEDGEIVTPRAEPDSGKFSKSVTSAPSAGTQANNNQTIQDQVIADDQIVQGSLCVGFDCVNGETFGFDTIRMKENNTRIKFDDTSTAGSFPNNDWQLTANDSTNGGANKFSIENTTAGRIPFTILGSAPTNSLFVRDNGNIGFGTSTPVVENHIVDGDTPTVRLEQDGSSGFTPQTWDMAGNETNFFVRDVTNGSRLPFKIRPGAATDSLVIDAEGDVAIGVANGENKLHVGENRDGNITNVILLENANANGGALMAFSQGAGESEWRVGVKNTDKFEITKSGSGEVEFEIIPQGEPGAGVYVNSALFVDAQQLDVPDYVFENDYELLSLDELQSFITEHKHLPGVPSSAEIQTTGYVDLNQFQMRLLEKIEELTLHTLAQEQRIKELQIAIQSK